MNLTPSRNGTDPRLLDVLWLVACIAVALVARSVDTPQGISGAFNWSADLITMGTALTLYVLFVVTGGFRPLLIMMLALVGGDTVLRLTYENAITVSAWASLVNATSDELVAFINAQWPWLIIATPLVIAGCFVPAPRLPWHWRKLVAMLLCSAFVALSLLTPLPAEEEDDYIRRRLALGAPKKLITAELVLKKAAAHLPVFDSMIGLIQTTSFIAGRNAPAEGAWEEVHQEGPAANLLVVVIGESLRADHLSVYGYPRNTTPGLKAAADRITVYPRAYSAGTNTWNSLPVAFTKYSHTTDMSLSFVTLAQAAGYKTHWLSNQTANDEWGLAVSMAARQADSHMFLPAGKPTYPKDGELLPYFEDIVAARTAGEKTMIVLHLYGSHSNFADRYPPDFDFFKAIGKKRIDQKIARYDNSIRYTDSVLTKVIGTTERANGAFLFFADHGLRAANSKFPLMHDISQKTAIDSLHVPLILAGQHQDRLSTEQVYSLFFFECLFSAWSGISAAQLIDDDYCSAKLSATQIQYMKPDLTVGKAQPPANP